MLKYSIIIPSYNQAKFLEKTIKSIINQDYNNYEIIIIDGGSSDGSLEIIKKYDDSIAYWVSEKDKGQSHAFNKGLAAASGDIIGWLNSDDVYYLSAIKNSAVIFEKYTDVDIVFGNYNFINENDKILKNRKEILFDYNIYLWTKDCYHANCAGFFKKKSFDQIGGLREDLQYGMDYEFYLRAAKEGMKFMHYKEFWGGYRLHSESKTVSAYSKQKIDANKIFYEYSYNENVIKKLILPPYYKTYRIIKKAIYGCYF